MTVTTVLRNLLIQHAWMEAAVGRSACANSVRKRHWVPHFESNPHISSCMRTLASLCVYQYVDSIISLFRKI